MTQDDKNDYINNKQGFPDRRLFVWVFHTIYTVFTIRFGILIALNFFYLYGDGYW